jgi:hypothetical protein
MKRKGERHIPDFSKKPKTRGTTPTPTPRADGGAAPPAAPPRPKPQSTSAKSGRRGQ